MDFLLPESSVSRHCELVGHYICCVAQVATAMCSESTTRNNQRPILNTHHEAPKRPCHPRHAGGSCSCYSSQLERSVSLSPSKFLPADLRHTEVVVRSPQDTDADLNYFPSKRDTNDADLDYYPSKRDEDDADLDYLPS